jgi:ATP-dependent Clp protease protease subunit
MTLCCLHACDGVTDPRLGPPPDLPSLLLHNRIVYVGMALVPAVTELVRGRH